MSILEQIDQAARRLNFDLRQRIAAVQDKVPGDLADAKELMQRQDFLRSSLCDSELAAKTLERVISGNELQPVNYLERGMVAARAVARIEIRQPNGSRYGWGTGFLVAPQLLLTNNHVLSESQWALRSEAQFRYELNLTGEPVDFIPFRLRPEQLFYTSPELDFTVIAVEEVSQDGKSSLADFGFLPLLDTPGKSLEGEWLTIIQHPAGERKQVCVRENRLLKRTDEVLWYSTDTLGGSSGAPVFNNDWFVVALHHSGVPETKNGKIQTVSGVDFDPRTMNETEIKWVANEGIRASRITETLKEALPSHPLLLPLFEATPESARITFGPAKNLRTATRVHSYSILGEDNHMAPNTTQTITIPITLQITGPSGLTFTAEPSGAAVTESAIAFKAGPAPAKGERLASFDAPFESNYDARKGYQPDFLGTGDLRIGFPQLSPALEQEVTRLINPMDENDYILHYHNFSLVMHKKRRFAIYSAANVSFASRYEMSRPRDVWRTDPRIPNDAQVGEFYYLRNKFDRGHLTRREDLEYGGTPKVALQSAGDTCHFTNCTPQHEKFNQNKEIWQGIERHVLEEAIIAGHFNAQVITGPIFDDSDPDYRQLQYPLQYWKVVAARNAAGDLFATAYLAGQEEVIRQYGVEAAPEVPFGTYKTFQVKISEIERLTGLTFVSGQNDKDKLSKYDPLETAVTRRRRVAVSATEVAAALPLPPGYVPLNDLDDIVIR